MRVAIDSNLAVSAILFENSVPGAVIDLWRSGQIEWVCCDIQLQELEAALFRPKILTKIPKGVAPIVTLLQQMQMLCHWATLLPPFPPVCRDPRDDFLFALIDQGHADAIISGDNDVLALKGRYPILTPRELIDRL